MKNREAKEKKLYALFEKKKRQCLESYYEFFKAFWHTISSEELILNWHIKYICEELQIVGEWVINDQPKEYDLLLNVPPGTSKTSMATVLFHPWIWSRKPSAKIITSSNAGPLSLSHSSLSKDCIKSPLYQMLFGDRFKIRNDFDSKSLYVNDKKGMRLATSTNASIIGQHAHLISVDDPVDTKGAKSSKILKTANDHVNETLPSRKVHKENTPMIMIMQRLKKGDPSGKWLDKADTEGKHVKHICLPATDDYPITPEEEVVEFNGESKPIWKWYEDHNGYLDPNRLNQSVLDEAETDLGSIQYAGQFGQQPSVVEGNIIKKHHFGAYELHLLPEGVNHVYIDTASSEQELVNNDPTGMLVYRRWGTKLYLVYYTEGRWTMPEKKRKVRWIADKFLLAYQSTIFIENKHNARSLKQELENEPDNIDLNIRLENLERGYGKMERVENELPVLEANRVLLPLSEPWAESFRDSCAVFPNGDHDESVDCLTGSIRTGLKGNKGILEPA